MSKLAHSCDETMRRIEATEQPNSREWSSPMESPVPTDKQLISPLLDALRGIWLEGANTAISTEREFVHSALVSLGQKIEKCGASPELTDAVCLCSDLRAAIGNRFNRPDEHALVRVHRAIGQ